MESNADKGLDQIVVQIESLLKDVSNEEYKRPLALFEGVCIGTHIRHIYEFYVQVFDGIESGCVDFSLRKREIAIEQNKELALLRFKTLNGNIINIDKSLKVSSDDHTILNSSVGRELMFAYDHAVHHMAIIRMAIKHHFDHCQFDDHIGYSKATIAHRQNKIS